MDVVFWLVIGVVSAWLAYSVVAGQWRARSGGITLIGLLLAVFGGVFFGLSEIYGFMRPKLIDDAPGENELLFVGLVILAVLAVLAADLIGKIDIMSQIQKSINNTDVGRPNPGGPSGPGGDD